MDIKELRESMNLTQEEFSKRFLININTLRSWEQGKRTPAQYVAEYIALAASQQKGADNARINN